MEDYPTSNGKMDKISGYIAPKYQNKRTIEVISSRGYVVYQQEVINMNIGCNIFVDKP